MKKLPCNLLMLLALAITPAACRVAPKQPQATPSAANALPAPEAAAEIRPATNSPAPAELLENYNGRKSGSPGWRRVLLEVRYRDGASREFTALNLWTDEAARSKTLVLLEEPAELRGTGYLLEENRVTAEGAESFLNIFLPTSEQDLMVSPGGDDEQVLLGTDFTYFDLRSRLPERDFNYRLLGASTLGGESVWALEATRKKASKWPVVRYYLAQNRPWLLGADYFTSPGAARPDKQLRAFDFQEQDGVWTPSRLTMHGSRHASALTLKETHFYSRGFEPAKLAAAELPRWSERLKQGWRPK